MTPEQRLARLNEARVFYGAAEFSRDCDIVLVAEPGNLAKKASNGKYGIC